MSDSGVLTHEDDPTDDQLRTIAEAIIEAIQRPKVGDKDALGMDDGGGWLPKLDLPSFGEAYDECGENRTRFCVCCGDYVQVGRTCARSMCPRCWVAWVLKRAGTSRENGEDVPGIVAQLDKTARMMSSELDTAVFKHHIVMSPPMDWFLGAEDPLERTKQVIKEIMDALNLQGVIFYHSHAGDNEDHEGDDRGAWKKRIGAGREWDDVRKELIPRGHFHVVGCSPFVPGAGVTERVEAETGWVIKRVEKRDGSGRSLSNLTDVARAVTYCLSHTGIDTSGDRNKAAYWKHGSTYHSGTVPEDVVQEADAAVRRVAPTTLGISADQITCHQEVPKDNAANSLATRFLGQQSDGGGEWDLTEGGGGGDTVEPESPGDPFEQQLASPGSSDVEMVECAGRLEPIREAEHYLEDEEWRERAPYAEKLQTTWEDWKEENGPPPD